MRVLSYNIHKGIGGRDRLYRLERIIEVIEAENPDLICLQEVDRNVKRSRFHNQPRLLSDYFKLDSHLYQLNVQLASGGYGNLVLSRWPFLTKHQISLTYKSRKRRGAQLVVVDTPEGKLHLVHFHLGLAEAERMWQVVHLIEHRLFRESIELPTLLIGDSNDWRDNLESKILKEQGFHQLTHPASKFRSFPAYMPVGALDKAFVSEGVYPVNVRIAKSAMIKKASDHCPLVIDFHLEKPALPT